MGMIKEPRANLDARWNKKGDKFVVGSSSGHVSIGTYSEQSNFWVAHPISKKPVHKASVVSVCFDISGRAIASCSLDGQVFIHSCFDENLDKDSTQGPFGSVTSYGDKLVKLKSSAWANFVTFSPSCKQICYGTQDCELNFADVSEAAGGKSKVKPERVNLRTNPHITGMFLTEDTFVAAGFDKVPYLYKMEGKEWKQVKTLDDGVSKQR